jgi:hypothetical protein
MWIHSFIKDYLLRVSTIRHLLLLTCYRRRMNVLRCEMTHSMAHLKHNWDYCRIGLISSHIFHGQLLHPMLFNEVDIWGMCAGLINAREWSLSMVHSVSCHLFYVHWCLYLCNLNIFTSLSDRYLGPLILAQHFLWKGIVIRHY